MNKQIVFTEKAPKAIGPYSQAVKYKDLIFVSGQLGINPETGKLRPDLESQARQALVNMKAILENAASGLEKILKTTVYLKNMDDFATVNRIYNEYITDSYPARSAIQVAGLPMGGLVEIEAISAATE